MTWVSQVRALSIPLSGNGGETELNVNQKDLIEGEDQSEDEGANHMQLKVSNDGDSSSSSGSYMADYRNFQFLQKEKEGKTENLRSIGVIAGTQRVYCWIPGRFSPVITIRRC